jgi:O-antigen/teichoic acid export membrane protein
MQWRSSKAVRHSTSSLAAQVVNALASLFQAAYLARHLRVVGYSEYSLVFSFNILFLAFTDLGLSQIAVREIVQYPDKVRSILSTVFSMRLFLGFAGWLACVVASAWTGYSSAVVGGIWIYSLVLLVSPLGTVSILNQIQFRGDLALLASTGSRVLLLAGTVAVVRLGMGLNALFAVAVGASVAEYVVNAFLVGGWRYLKPCWDMATGKSLAQEALPLGLASLLATVINRFDVVLLSKMSGMQAVGIYSAPFRVAYFLTFIPQAAMASFYPLVSEYRQAQPDRVREVYQHTVELMAFLALPMAVGGTLLAPRVIPLIFGETFQASVRVFQVLVWQVAIVFVAIVPGTLLIAHGLQRVNLGLQAITVCISLLLNLLLIPSLGALAPALATLAAHVFLVGSKRVVIPTASKY